jgi:hypothetical protein
VDLGRATTAPTARDFGADVAELLRLALSVLAADLPARLARTPAREAEVVRQLLG